MWCLRELEKENVEKLEEREMKRRKFELEVEEKRRQAEWEMEERRREAERKHEERMNYMFMNFMKEVIGRPGNYPPAGGHPSDHLGPGTYPHPTGRPTHPHGPRPHPPPSCAGHHPMDRHDPSGQVLGDAEYGDYYTDN